MTPNHSLLGSTLVVATLIVGCSGTKSTNFFGDAGADDASAGGNGNGQNGGSTGGPFNIGGLGAPAGSGADGGAPGTNQPAGSKTADAGSTSNPGTPNGGACTLQTQVSPNAACNTCAQTSCCAKLNQCIASADCTAFDGCVTECTSYSAAEQTECVQACVAEYPSAATVWQTASQCLRSACLSVCSG